jgi:hypothetical protein
MLHEKFIKSKNLLQFRVWTVGDGPRVWETQDVWRDIEEKLAEERVPEAAHALRRYLEFVCSDLTVKMRVRLEARHQANYDLGDMMPAVIGKWKEILGKAKASAQSWKQMDKFTILNEMSARFSSACEQTNAEQWSVNAAVHYNEWASLRKQDFVPVAKAFQDLLAELSCDTCGVWLHVTPSRGEMEAIACDCGKSNFTLKKQGV